MMSLKRIGLLAAVIGSSLYMRHVGNLKMSNIILFIPVVLMLLAAISFLIMA